MRDNIVLIGMPGCGKSTLGIVLAKMLCMDFVDVDLVIQKKIGMPLQEYIDSEGVDAFLELEADTVVGLECENTVIATGGSAVMRTRAAERLSSLGTVVYLSLPLHEIEKRVTNLETRGIAMKAGESLSDVYELRRPIYEKYAEITADVSRGDIAMNCRALCDLFGKGEQK
ncbi:MAG: shikimate kinase [Ruminococcaceae bacterium]|nr:shikimate kinase [Oscillospiraceae bacterium]